MDQPSSYCSCLQPLIPPMVDKQAAQQAIYEGLYKTNKLNVYIEHGPIQAKINLYFNPLALVQKVQ